MTSDDFLAGLRADWRRTPIDLSHIKGQAARRQIWAAFLNLVSLAGTFSALILGFWFAWRAFALQDLVTGVGAVALFASAPALLFEYLEGRGVRNLRYDDTPHGVLLQTRELLAFSGRLQIGCRLCAIILGTGALALLVVGLFDPGSARRAYVTASAWGATAALVWLWYLWRRRRLDREVAQCERLLAEIGEENGA